MSIVPAIGNQLVKQPVEKYYDLSCLRVLISGAAALSKEITQGLTDKFGCFVFQGTVYETKLITSEFLLADRVALQVTV